MFGIGCATAEDRLFFIDALRHAGQGDLASFAGGANVPMDESVWEDEPYTQQDLQSRSTRHRQPSRRAADHLRRDELRRRDQRLHHRPRSSTRCSCPASTRRSVTSAGPQPFTLEDIVSIASLVGGDLGHGGGDQLQNGESSTSSRAALRRRALNVAGSPEARQGQDAGKRHRRAAAVATTRLRHASSASSIPTTPRRRPPCTARRSRTRRCRAAQGRAGEHRAARPGASVAANPVGGAAPSGSRPALPRTRGNRRRPRALPPDDAAGRPARVPAQRFERAARRAPRTDTGHPIAVMGPQVSYFSPQILMEEDIHGPGIDADGAAFPGTNIYVELGHGADYAWSATSAGQNIIDTFAVPLCNPSGGAVVDRLRLLRARRPVRADADADRQRVVEAEPRRHDAGRSVTFQTLRTAYGIVIARATIHGRPVVYTNLRSTYMHELDSALGFEQFNEPAAMRSPQDFCNAAVQDRLHVQLVLHRRASTSPTSTPGRNPVRAAGTDPLFPTWATDRWKGYQRQRRVDARLARPSADTPQSAHPQAIDQPYLTSWNNKQAPGYNDAATGQEYSSVYRSQLLDQNIKHYLSRGTAR